MSRPFGHATRTVFGIPLRIEPSWLLLAALITWSLAHGYFPRHAPGLPVPAYWVMGLVASVALVFCILLHELGHSLVARQHGIPVACVTLFLFGGVAQITRQPRRPAVELAMALAGPLVSGLIAAACWQASEALPRTAVVLWAGAAVLRYLAVLNLALLIFNLLPGFPLDGGRVLRALLWAATGDLLKATRIASSAGMLLGLALLMLGGWAIVRGAWWSGAWDILLGWYLRQAASSSYRQAAAGG